MVVGSGEAGRSVAQATAARTTAERAARLPKPRAPGGKATVWYGHAVIGDRAAALDRARDARWLAAVVAVALLVYANALGVPFISDDLSLIVNSDFLRASRWHDAFLTSLWGPVGKDVPYYRPIPVLLFKASYHLFGLRPEPLHVASAILHAGASAIVFALGRRTMPGYGAAAAAALFAVHPIHTEAVTWVSGIMDVSCAFFSLVAIALHARGTRTSSVAGAAALLLALLSKETALVVPALLVGHDWIFRRRLSIPGLVPHAAVLVAYAGLRWAVLESSPAAALLPLGAAVTNVSAAIWYYASHLVVPVPLDFAPSLPGLGVGAAFAAAAGVVAVLLVVARAGRPQAFAVVLASAPILPALVVAATTGSEEKAVAERYLYLPSAGIALLWGMLLTYLSRPPWLRAAAGCAVVVAGAALTISRNSVWQDPVALWTDAVERHPDMAYARVDRGLALLRAGRQAEGARELARAGQLDPTLPDRWIATALGARERGMSMKPILDLQVAILLAPTRVEARTALAEIYRDRGWYAMAADEYRRIVAIAGESPESRNNLGVLLAQTGDYDAALAEFERAHSLDPGNTEIRRNVSRAREEVTARGAAGPGGSGAPAPSP